MNNIRKLIILYGSQTGTAQEVAEQAGREAERYLFDVNVSGMDQYPVENLLNESVALFVCSTTGQGEEPDNMKTFWKCLLRSRLPPTSLSRLKFGVIGLGDSSYEKYNFVAKKLRKRLMQLGAISLLDIALGDDQHDFGPDAVIVPWMQEWWKILSSLHPLPEDRECIPKHVLLPSKFNIKYSSMSNSSSTFSIPSGFMEGKILENIRLTTLDHFQDVRLLTVDIPDCSYSAGDIAIIHPGNLSENILKFSGLFHFDLDAQFFLQTSKVDSIYPPLLCVKECLEWYWDIQGVPRRYFFELLSHFTSSELEKEKLLEFISLEGQSDLNDYCYKPRRTALESFDDFPNCRNIPIEYIFELLPVIKPRFFSIASSNHKSTLQILVAVVKYKTRMYTPRLGLCSNWLARLEPGMIIPIKVKKGSFLFPDPKKPFSPVIFIGPGTGVAPFRSFIQDVSKYGVENGHVHLFFGCRSKTKDFYFEDEWEDACSRGFLTLYTAFSRDQDHKIYVQHKMQENSSLLWKLIDEEHASIYIAGNAKEMPKEVRDTLKLIFKQEGKMSPEEAENHLKFLSKHHRLQLETWS